MSNSNSQKENENFRNRLRKLREDAHYTYKDLEKLTGISRSTLQRYETSSAVNIKLNRLSALAKAYNVSIAYLMGYESKDLPSEDYYALNNILGDLGYQLIYDDSTESHYLTDNEKKYYISESQIKEFKATLYTFLKFQIQQICSTTE